MSQTRTEKAEASLAEAAPALEELAAFDLRLGLPDASLGIVLVLFRFACQKYEYFDHSSSREIKDERARLRTHPRSFSSSTQTTSRSLPLGAARLDPSNFSKFFSSETCSASKAGAKNDPPAANALRTSTFETRSYVE